MQARQSQAGAGQLGPTKAAVGQHEDGDVGRNQVAQQPPQPFLAVVLAVVPFPLRVAGPQQGQGSASEDGRSHQGVQGADLDPIQRDQQRLAASSAQPLDEATHAVGDGDAAVDAETPGAFDLVLAQGGPGQVPSQGSKADGADPDGGGDEVGEGFGLAFSQG